MEIIEKAKKEGRKQLSESESKQVLAAYKIPVTKEIPVTTQEELVKAAEAIGFPMVLKGNSPDIAHKTEKGMIRVDIRNLDEAKKAFDEIMAAMAGAKGDVLVQEMV
ncbi:MAG: acetate--CoA ligase family protein, partial [Proteobacteria bacterium]|nr:acetate--CoA ligase family protein [Pseudomonadota bacterium]